MTKKTILLSLIGVIGVAGAAAALYWYMFLRPAEVSGGAWLNNKSGESNLCRALQISLCSSDLLAKANVAQLKKPMEEEWAAKTKELVNKAKEYSDEEARKALSEIPDNLGERWTESYIKMAEASHSLKMAPVVNAIKQIEQAKPWGILHQIIPSLTKSASACTLKTAWTDMDGKFIFSGLNPGKYVIYAFQDSDQFCCYWMIPVTATPGQKVVVYLDNKSVSELHNSAGD